MKSGMHTGLFIGPGVWLGCLVAEESLNGSLSEVSG